LGPPIRICDFSRYKALFCKALLGFHPTWHRMTEPPGTGSPEKPHKLEIWMTNYRADYLSDQALTSMPFKSLGHDVMIHERVTLVGIENISIGCHVRIDPDVILLATGSLTIGCYTHIAPGVFIAAKAGFEMKNFANIAHGARIYTVNDDYSGQHLMGPTIPEDLLSLSPGPVLMEEHANIGAGAIVLPGVTLAEGSVLGALSLIGKSTEPWTIYGGVPAKPIGERRRDVIGKGQELLKSDRFTKKSAR
jgi:acetyltransferase-like isoleucine patch superfamily enzyme